MKQLKIASLLIIVLITYSVHMMILLRYVIGNRKFRYEIFPFYHVAINMKISCYWQSVSYNNEGTIKEYG